MSIGQNIAKFRKEKDFTQEELGVLLGVSNQAVSKWENEIAMPDVMLLPDIASVLGVTLEMLYGLQDRKPAPVDADDFPKHIYEVLTKEFFDHCKCRFGYVGEEEQYLNYLDSLKKGELLTCVSNTAGCVEIGADISFVDTTINTDESVDVLDSYPIANLFSVLSDENCRKILKYQYQNLTEMKSSTNRFFSLSEISEKCNICEKDVVSALERLTAYDFQARDTNQGQEGYYFHRSQMRYIIALFNLANRLLSTQVHLVLRDSSKISDYAFEACEKS